MRSVNPREVESMSPDPDSRDDATADEPSGDELADDDATEKPDPDDPGRALRRAERRLGYVRATVEETLAGVDCEADDEALRRALASLDNVVGDLEMVERGLDGG